MRLWSCIASTTALPACGDDGDAAPATAAAAATAAPAPPGLAAGEIGALLDALRQGHAEVRRANGTHRLHVRTVFDLTPQGEPATPEPAVDELRPVAQHVEDELELLWLTTAPNVPRFSLSQSNEHDHGRDVVVDGERIYTRQKNRTWYVGPLQSDLYGLWLDDAQRAVYDAVALAAPQLAITVAPGDGDTLRFTLARSGATDPTRVVDDARSAWRRGASIDAVEGSLELDATSGAWRSAEVHVGFSMRGPDGRTLAGRVDLEGQTVAVDATTPLPVPADAQPLQERTRYDAERARLLDGLAGR